METLIAEAYPDEQIVATLPRQVSGDRIRRGFGARKLMNVVIKSPNP